MQSFIQPSRNGEDILTEEKLRYNSVKVLICPNIHWGESAEVRDYLGSILEFILPIYMEIPVLVLIGIEVVLFIVVSLELSFGFVTKTVLITQGCFSYC